MRKPQILTICLSILVGCILASTLNRTLSGQPPQPQPALQEAVVWRYQLTAPIEGAFSGHIILTDTATGRCWTHLARDARNAKDNDWVALGSPAVAQK